MTFLPRYFTPGNRAKVNTIKQKTSFMNKDVYCSGTYASVKLQKKNLNVPPQGDGD